MEQMELDERKKYKDLTEEMRRTQESTVENFIVMGFILKQVESERLYRFDNFKDIYEYGQKMFGQSRSTVSRCKNINTKYSVGGNSRELLPEYKGYYKSTLQEMLDLPESDMELITAKTPVDQVKELKDARKEQQKLEKAEQENSLPLVRMAAGNDDGSRTPELEAAEPFEALFTSFWRENMDLYRKVAAGLVSPEIVAEEISPSGSMTYRSGVNIAFFYDFAQGIKMRSYEKGKAEITPYTYQEFIEKTKELDLSQKNQESEKKTRESTGNIDPPKEEAAAAPQSVEEEEAVQYTPIPGQTSVSDLQGAMPDLPQDSAKTLREDPDNPDTDGGNVIDGECRELDESTVQEITKESGAKAGKECPYTDVEIKNAISFFDIEYSRMAGLQQDTTKQRNYKIALECIRRCYKSVAKQADREMYGIGV